VLDICGVTKQIGGLIAVKDVNLTLGANEILGLVGLNGAGKTTLLNGKTTLLNIISGITKPTSGSIKFFGDDITGLPANRICRKGIAKTFQIAHSFPGLSAEECVQIGALFGSPRTISTAQAQEEAKPMLRFVGMPEDKDEICIRNLNVVELKKVQLARALASQPKLLFLDELTTGLTPIESADAIALIRKIRDAGISILIIEHVMSVIMGISDRIVVLDHGEKIADGKPHHVINDQRVIETYLGDMDIF